MKIDPQRLDARESWPFSVLFMSFMVEPVSALFAVLPRHVLRRENAVSFGCGVDDA
jgi:hypothetical protein